mgnify:CR=1 FL=1
MTYKTIEQASFGATYKHDANTFTVYEIGEYDENSVLAGQQSRTFLDSFDSFEDAKEAFPDAELIDGSTYQEPSLHHLPDGPDDY